MSGTKDLAGGRQIETLERDMVEIAGSRAKLLFARRLLDQMHHRLFLGIEPITPAGERRTRAYLQSQQIRVELLRLFGVDAADIDVLEPADRHGRPSGRR